MRRLMLLRHAKAERAKPGMRDHDRALEAVGRADAQVIGAYLGQHGFVPDLAVVSPTRRTRETWEHASAAFVKRPAISDDERLYDASPQTILEVIHEAPATAGLLLVVGHNPGMHEAARLLIASGDIEHRERLNEEFPTSALAVIDFAVDDWSKVHAHAGRLERFVSPRLLAAATD